MKVSLRRQGVVVAMLAGVSVLAVVTAFVLLARFQTVSVRPPAGIETSRGPVARVEVAPELTSRGPAAITGQPGAAQPVESERSCGNDPPAPG